MFSSLQYTSPYDAMYPPPGSFKYHTPKPIRNGSACRNEDDDEINCDKVFTGFRFILSMPCFHFKFWKISILIVLALSTVQFSALVTFKRVTEPLFVVKSNLKASESIQKVNHTNNSSFHSYRIVTPKISTESRGLRRNYDKDKIKNHSVINLTTKYNNSIINSKSSVHLKKTSATIHANLEENLSRSLLDQNTERKALIQKYGTREKSSTSKASIANGETELKLCPPIPPNLDGPVKVELENVPDIEIQEKSHSELLKGGSFKPSECIARHKVAIIIPFRDRAAHLAVFLYNIHPFLQKQQIDYAIYIVDQAGKEKFNRALLMNIGSIEALKLYPYDCFIFHDVDLIPEDDRNLYTCPTQPRHMSVAINTMKYKLPYNDIFGGVSAMTVEQFKTVNGFSNKFWGWGGEDDDMSNRIKFHGFYISRYPANIARYTMMSHKKDHPNPMRFKFLNEGKKRFSTDGLNNVKYKMLDIQFRKLYTWFNVEVKKT